jgi:hypothetical protein
MACPPAAAPVQGATPEVQSYTPSWSSGGCVTKAKNLLAEPWVFRLWDIDLLSDDSITQSLQTQLSEQSFVAGSVSLGANGGMQSLTVQLQKQ